MRVAFLMGLFPKDNRNEIIKNSRGPIQFAADALEWGYVKGISEQNIKCELFNAPFIGSYPKRYGKPFYTSYSNEKISKWVNLTNVGFCNYTGYKLISRWICMKRSIRRWYGSSYGDTTVLIVYSIHTPFLKAAVDIKRKYKNTKVVLIVPDLPEYMDSKKSFIQSIFHHINRRIQNKLYEDVDGYVLLSKYMQERLPVKGKAVSVIEGMYYSEFDNHFLDGGICMEQSDEKILLYTGTLDARYGIVTLLRAFMMLKNPSYRLVICGDGDSRNTVLECVKMDNRVSYKGQLPREEILVLQQKATLLVIPRTSEGEVIKYSFPSETIEYLASGTPVLLYKLAGIPDEYYEYCFTVEDNSDEALSKKIDEILNMDRAVLRSLGMRARKFILTEKSPKNQCKKLVDLIERIVES